MSAPTADFYQIDELLTPEERLVRDSVRAFVKDKFQPRVRQCYRDGTFPADLIPDLGQLGIFGITIKGYGCPGLSYAAYGLAMQELEAGDSGLRSFASVQGGLSMTAINLFGTEEQKKKYLPELARAKLLSCFGLTEPDFGSNPGGMRTKARKDGDSWVINGNKMWITNGSVAGIAIVWAKAEGDDSKDIRGFIVPTDAKGFKAHKIEGKLSMRASVTSELTFEDVRVPQDAILPGAQGLSGPLSCLNHARYGIAWGTIGAARSCFDEALSYAKNRVQFTKPIAGYQLTQEKFADMLSEITKAQLLAWRLSRLMDAGEGKHFHISMAKRNNCQMALQVARTCRSILGGNGIVDEYGALRHASNLETVATYEGTHEMHTLILGEQITGIPAFF